MFAEAAQRIAARSGFIDETPAPRFARTVGIAQHARAGIGRVGAQMRDQGVIADPGGQQQRLTGDVGVLQRSGFDQTRKTGEQLRTLAVGSGQLHHTATLRFLLQQRAHRVDISQCHGRIGFGRGRRFSDFDHCAATPT